MKFKPTGKHNAVYDIVLEKGHNEKWEPQNDKIKHLIIEV